MNTEPDIPASYSPDGASARHQQISALAYALWRESGSPWGREDELWYVAERQLSSEAVPVTTPAPASTPSIDNNKNVEVVPSFDGDILRAEVVPNRTSDTSLTEEVDKSLDEIHTPGRDRASPTSATV